MKPILFNTKMVRAILEGRKTVTRRLVKPSPPPRATGEVVTAFRQADGKWSFYVRDQDGNWMYASRDHEPPCQEGDVLYVRETWQYAYDADGNDQIIEESGRYFYAADDAVPFNDWIMPDGTHRDTMPWRPSIHMPKKAARIFLRVTEIRPERLKQMQIEDYIKEGIKPRPLKRDGCRCKWETEECHLHPCANRDSYETLEYALPFDELWDSTVPPAEKKIYGHNANPWVWVISFERCEKPEDVE